MPKPKPLTDLQSAQQQVQAAYDPVLQQIRDAYTQMVQNTGTTYNAGAKQLADLYGQYGPAVQQAYSQAGQGMAAVQGMLAATQAGQGAAAQGDLARQLQGIDAATAGRVGGNFGSNLQGQALANATMGGNNIAALLAEGAHAGQFGALLPAIGGSIGLQGLRSALGSLNQNQQDELSKLAAEEPGAVQTALAGIQSNRYKQEALNNENFYKQQLLGNSTAKANAPKIVHTGDGSVIAVDPNTGQQVATISGPRATKPTKPTTFKGSDGRTYIYDPKTGTAKLIAGQSGPKTKQPKPLTPSETRTTAGTANTIASVAFNGGTDSKGNPLKPLTYQQAIAEMRNEGLLADPQHAKLALAALNRLYAPGVRGRPVAKKTQAEWQKAGSWAATPPLGP
jgi:hypothetical protein